MERLDRLIPYLALISAVIVGGILLYGFREGAPARAMREALEQAAKLPQSVDADSPEAAAATMAERAARLRRIDVSETPADFQAAWERYAAAVERGANALAGGVVTRPEDFGPYVQAMQDSHAQLIVAQQTYR